MREILFRGKREDDGEWVYGDLTHLSYGITTINYNNIVDPKTVGQYTGLKDKNGTRIFEGDIVKSDDTIGVVEWSLWELNRDYGFCCWCAGDFSIGCYKDFTTNDVEVIGNIHGNPELLGRG